MKSALKPAIFLVFLWASIEVAAQQIQIQLGPEEIGENQAWTMAITTWVSLVRPGHLVESAPPVRDSTDVPVEDLGT